MRNKSRGGTVQTGLIDVGSTSSSRKIKKALNDEELMKKIQDAWLGIDVKDAELFNPLYEVPSICYDKPELFIVWMMQQPEYVSFICKYIIGIDLLPKQSIIINTMWEHKFPMLIASRGFGKCERDCYVESETGFVKINDLCAGLVPMKRNYTPDLKLRGENGFNQVEYKWSNGYSETIKIRTRHGFEKECTPEHPIRLVRDGKIAWVEAKDIKLGDYVPIVRDENWFPVTNNLPEDLARFFGILVGDGGYTVRGRITISTADSEILDFCNQVSQKYFDKTFKQSKSRKYDYMIYSTEVWDSLFQTYGFNSSACGEKEFPKCILSAKKQVAAAFIRGLMDTDGSARSDILGIEYCSKSKELVKCLQFLLTKFGIISRIKRRHNKKYSTDYYYLYIFGNDVKLFAEKIGFGLSRKQNRLLGLLDVKCNTNQDIVPIELLPETVNRKAFGNRKNPSYKAIEKYPECKDILDKHYYFDKIVSLESGFAETYDVHIPGNHSFISSGFISHNTFLMAVYCLLRMLLLPGRKIVLCGSVFRQSKLIFEYMEFIARNSSVMSSILGNDYIRRESDRLRFVVGESSCLAIPIGDGQNIRGLRANDIITDEFATHNPEIFETVIAGFGSVVSDPITGVKIEASKEAAKLYGVDINEQELSEELLGVSKQLDNQIVITGTAFYDFNHFAKYWKRWHDTICCKNESAKRKLANEAKLDGLNPSNYAIIRIPYELIPKGFMDSEMVARSKATVTSGIYEMEFGATFSKDSKGFYKRSLIEKCVCHPQVEFSYPSETFNGFTPSMIGNPKYKYVMGIDPASEKSRFAIVILELHPEHRRVVYTWTTRRAEFSERAKNDSSISLNFYAFCARKIRDLCMSFNIERIALDAGGGGITVMEALHDKNIANPGEPMYWPITDFDKKLKPEDMYDGRHIIDLINFSDTKWTAESNHGLKFDLEHKMLLFPYVDAIELAEATTEDIAKNRQFDTLEDCVIEIEELKNELATIIIVSTPTGKERWDTPDVKINSQSGVQRGKINKDRYSALLLANWAGRQLQALTPDVIQLPLGGVANPQGSKQKHNAGFLAAPDFYKKSLDRFDSFG